MFYLIFTTSIGLVHMNSQFFQKNGENLEAKIVNIDDLKINPEGVVRKEATNSIASFSNVDFPNDVDIAAENLIGNIDEGENKNPEKQKVVKEVPTNKRQSNQTLVRRMLDYASKNIFFCVFVGFHIILYTIFLNKNWLCRDKRLVCR